MAIFYINNKILPNTVKSIVITVTKFSVFILFGAAETLVKFVVCLDSGEYEKPTDTILQPFSLNEAKPFFSNSLKSKPEIASQVFSFIPN